MKSHRLLSSLSVCILALVLLPAGCTRNTPPAPSAPAPVVEPDKEGWGYGDPRGGKTAGLDYGCVLYWKWDETVALGVWIDHTARSKGRAESSAGKFELKGSLLTQSEEPLVEISCTTADGKAGRLTVGGQELELSDGWLVLVSAGKGKSRFKQLKRPVLQDLKNGAKPFQAMKGDPEIVAFFAPKAE